MIDTATLVADPELLSETPDYDLELTAREVVELLRDRAKADAGDRGIAYDCLSFVAEIYKRDPDFACAVIMAYSSSHCNVNMLIKVATERKNEDKLKAFLDWLRGALNPNANTNYDRRRADLVRRTSAVRGCMWAGFDAVETRKRTKHYRMP